MPAKGFIVLLLLAFLLPGGTVRAEMDASEPWRYLQALQTLQDRIAHGDRRAVRAQGRLTAYIGRQFASMPDEVWKRRLNAEGLFVYVLSGGDPEPARRLLERKVEMALPEGALAGAVAFVSGRNGEAWRHLQAVEEEGMSVTARAQLALVRASLRAAAAPAEALHLLARVRLMKPGTLMEEAALRRGLFLAGGEGDVKTVMRLASAYIRRFRDSWYVSDFLRRLSWLLVRLDHGRRPYLVERMEPVLGRLTVRQQALLHAAVSRAALIEGKLGLAEHSGKRALELFPDVRRFAARVRTWIAAAGVVSPHPEEALKTLEKVRADLLDPRDRALRTAAMMIGRAIMEEPQEAPVGAGKAGTSSGEDASPLMKRASVVMRDIEKLLERDGKR